MPRVIWSLCSYPYPSSTRLAFELAGRTVGASSSTQLLVAPDGRREELLLRERCLELPLHEYLRVFNVKLSKRNCAICLEGFSKRRVANLLPCRHLFHRGCLTGWLKLNDRCPMCRLNLRAWVTLDLAEQEQ